MAVPGSLVGPEREFAELLLMPDKPAWGTNTYELLSNIKTSLLPGKPAAGVEMWVTTGAQARNFAWCSARLRVGHVLSRRARVVSTKKTILNI